MWQASSLPTSMPKLLPWAWALPHSLPSQILILTPVSDCQSFITTLSRVPARQSDSVCNSVWFHHSSISKTSSIRVQWIPACAGIADNTGRLGGQAELHPSSVLGPARPSNAAAKVLIRRTGQEESHGRYIRDPHSATHRTLTGKTNSQAHWRFGWTRSQCITFAQLTTGHSPILASYLHRIGWQQSPVCPHCRGDDETAQHLLLCCLLHASARTSTNCRPSAHVVLSSAS